MFVTRQLRMDHLLLHGFLFNAYALVQGGVAPHRPLITPTPVAYGCDDAHQALRRQLITTSLADTCGYVNAAVLEPRGCAQGYTCYAESSLSVAGGCCRLGDAANCQLPTACVAQADKSSSCDSSCSADKRTTKCDLASPYCYTNYWPTPGQTFSEVGCTTAQGQFAYVYSTYTGFGAEIEDLTTGSQATNPPISATNTNGDTGDSEQTGSSSPSGTSVAAGSDDNGGSSGPSMNTGAIAGGVVGGVAVLGLIAALITWIVLRNRRKERAALGIAGGSGDGQGDPRGNNELKPPQEHIAAVSPTSSHTLPRRPVGQELQTEADRHEVAGYAEARELQSQSRRVPELP